MAYRPRSQVHLLGVMCSLVQVDVCQFVDPAKQSGFVEFIEFQYMFPFSNNRMWMECLHGPENVVQGMAPVSIYRWKYYLRVL
jgi:hypothetical protein